MVREKKERVCLHCVSAQRNGDNLVLRLTSRCVPFVAKGLEWNRSTDILVSDALREANFKARF